MKNRSEDIGVRSIRLRMSWTVFAVAGISVAAVADAHQDGTDQSLVNAYNAVKSERRLYLRDYERELEAEYTAGTAGDSARRKRAEDMLRAALGDLALQSPQTLASRISAEGSADPANYEMRDAALHLAMLWRVTGDESHGQRAAALLARFAEVIPTWPIWGPYYGKQSDKKRFSQSDPAAFKSEFSAGLWGDWIYQDLILGTPLAQAWSILRASDLLNRIGADGSVRAMLDLHVATQRKYGASPDFSNMDAFQIRGFLEFGRLLPDPELVHDGVRHLRNMYQVGFLPDGWWHEGATSYHVDLQNGLRSVASEMLRNYCDPPGFKSRIDGTRYDNLDLRKLVAGPSGRADSVTRRMTMPDQTLMAVHDTAWPQLAPGSGQATASSFLFGAMGQGTLVTGRNGDIATASLHWGPSGSHSHRDALNLNLWAQGTEVISETQYHPLEGSDSTREWHTSTAGHATVVVDEVDQCDTGKLGSRIRRRQLLDAIPGVPDWPWRWTTCAAQDGGKLRMFSNEFDDVQIVEADAERSYDSVAPVKLYRRTVALVRIDEKNSYVVDIFRIRGGSTFDYMLHSALQLEQTLKVSLELQQASGVIQGNIRNLRGQTTDASWIAAFALGNGVNMLTFMAGAPQTRVIVGDGPAMRRLGSAPFVVVRRTGSETVFAAVHHAFQGSVPQVQGIELLPTTGTGCVALRVRVGSRADTVISCEDREQAHTVDGRIEIRARFAHLSEQGKASWAYMVDGDLLQTAGATIRGETSWTGTVKRTLSSEIGGGQGDAGFVVDAQPPAGRGLAGSTIIVDLAGEMTLGYRLSGVTINGDDCVLQTADEPGFTVGEGTIKQYFFPCWGFAGTATWKIPGFALLRRDGRGGEEFTQSRDAKLLPGGSVTGRNSP